MMVLRGMFKGLWELKKGDTYENRVLLLGYAMPNKQWDAKIAWKVQ